MTAQEVETLYGLFERHSSPMHVTCAYFPNRKADPAVWGGEIRLMDRMAFVLAVMAMRRAESG